MEKVKIDWALACFRNPTPAPTGSATWSTLLHPETVYFVQMVLLHQAVDDITQRTVPQVPNPLPSRQETVFLFHILPCILSLPSAIILVWSYSNRNNSATFRLISRTLVSPLPTHLDSPSSNTLLSPLCRAHQDSNCLSHCPVGLIVCHTSKACF